MTDSSVSVVGIALTYPDAKTPDEYWDSIVNQRTAFRSIPDCRMPLREYLPTPGRAPSPDSSYVRSAGLISGWRFDTDKFRVPIEMFQAADTTHWLALDTAARLIDDLVSSTGQELPTARTGVVLGNSLGGEIARSNSLRLRWPMIARTLRQAAAQSGCDLPEEMLATAEDLFRGAFPPPGDEMLAGSLANTIAGRICNFYDFHGTGYTVDGACSSSLLAIIHARTALLAGELDLAIAGGVDISIDPFELVGFSRLDALGTDEMRVYDEEPTGFLPGEGCGLVALMRTEDALTSGHTIYARILAGASSSDGRGGLTRPSLDGHLRAAHRAYEQCRLDPATVDLFEGHGTGTKVGDPIELEVFRTLRRDSVRPAAVGSVKANIGHTKAAAGAAGLIKAVLAIHHGVLPPATGIRRAHPLLKHNPHIHALSEPQPWAGNRFAGVSAMGFGGINTHVVLGQGPSENGLAMVAIPPSTRTGPDELWVLTADSSAEIESTASRLLSQLEVLSDAESRDLGVRLTAHANPRADYRMAFTARDRSRASDALIEGIAMLKQLSREGSPGTACRLRRGSTAWVGVGRSARIGLLFPGQAAPWVPPGTVLESLAPHDELLGAAKAGIQAGLPPSGVSCNDTRYAQPSIVGGSLLGLAWLRSVGVTATAAVGHSLGEITSLVWADAISPRDGVSLALARGAAMSEHGDQDTGMSSVMASEESVAKLLQDLNDGFTDPNRLVIAASNSPTQTVVAGPRPRLGELRELARRRSIPCSLLPVSHGFHSPAMLPALEAVEHALDQAGLRSPSGTVISSVSGRELGAPGPEELRSHLKLQVLEPVRFDRAVSRLGRLCDLLIECGPGSTLSKLAAESTDKPALSLSVGDEPRALAETCAALAAAGAINPASAWVPVRSRRPLPLHYAPKLLTNPCGYLDGKSPDSPMDPGPRPLTLPDDGCEPVPGVDDEAARGTDRSHPTKEQPSVEDVKHVLIGIVAELAGLDADLITPGLTFSGDLHLNSLQVGQIVRRATDLLERGTPEVPLSLSDATLDDAATVLAALPGTCGGPTSRMAGTRAWVAQFIDEWIPITSEPAKWADYSWTHSNAESMRPLGGPSALFIDIRVSEEAFNGIAQALPALQDGAWDAVIVVHSGGGASLARSVFSERKDTVVVAVETVAAPEVWVGTMPFPKDGFLDLRWNGSWQQRTAQRHTGPRTGLDLRRGDVCLVTGGLTGITAECAAELAACSGVELIFTGRRSATAPEITDRIANFKVAGISARYIQADLTEAADIDRLMEQVASGAPPTGLVHGAAINIPERLQQVTESSLVAADAIKSVAFQKLLSRWPVDHPLKLIVSFGSIIARSGLSGELSYGLANDRLQAATELAAAKYATATTRHLEWSVWSGVGMGVRLDVLDTLIRAGVEPITPDAGRCLFMEALSTRGPVTRLLTGRFPPQPTVVLPSGSARPFRFIETIVAHTPGVELVAEAELSVPTDLAIADHVFDGVPIMPAVMGLEAAAQAASALCQDTHWDRFDEVKLFQPVTVRHDEHVVLRTVATMPDPRCDEVQIVVRSSNDAFANDSMTMTARSDSNREDRLTPPPDLPPTMSDVTAPSPYGPLLFHGPAFHRLEDLGHVSASRLSASLATGHGKWFSSFLPSTLLLGDPGLLDATIHALQCCNPDRRLLPVAADSIEVLREPCGPSVSMHAAEAFDTTGSERNGDLVFNVQVHDPEGIVVEWLGLRLRPMGEFSKRHVDPRLLGARLARWARALGCVPIDVGVCSDALTAIDSARLLSQANVFHSPSGRLLARPGWVSTSTNGHLRLTAYSPSAAVGVDLVNADHPELAPTLASADAKVANSLRVPNPALALWAAREAVAKTGRSSQFTVRTVSSDTHDVVLAAPDGLALVTMVGQWVAALYIETEKS